MTHNEGPCLVLAGPGSGKTFTIVSRIQYLIEEVKVRPEEILVITFTKKAALEMQERFLRLNPVNHRGQEDFRPVRFGTFHSIYYHILRWAYRFTDQNILKDSEKYHILRNICAKFNVDMLDEEGFLSDISAEIGVCKNNMIPFSSHIPSTIPASEFRNIAEQFEKTRKELRKVDFDDMLVLCYELLSTREEALSYWQNQFSYILVDEFQDINLVQYKVLQLLASKHKNLFVVGDDDQAIYGFRGADSKLMFRFEEEFQCRKVVLDQNFRSTKNIIKQASKLVSHNSVRYKKRVTTANETGHTIHLLELEDAQAESKYVLQQIQHRIKEGVLLSEIAILYRVHTEAQIMADTLIRANVPFVMKEFLPNPFEHTVAQDIISYMKLAMGLRSRTDFLRVMNKPVRYISRDAIVASTSHTKNNFHDQPNDQSCPNANHMTNHISTNHSKYNPSHNTFNHQNKTQVSFEHLRWFYEEQEWMLDRIDELEWQVKMMSKMTPYAVLQFILHRIGYLSYIQEQEGQQSYSNNATTRVKDMIDFLEESVKEQHSIKSWLQYVEDYSTFAKNKSRGLAVTQPSHKKHDTENGISLMTIHSSKGLEFDSVYIIGANEGMIPYKRSVDTSLEEERRLFYVALTRAKKLVTVTWVKEKNGKAITPSRFIRELT